MVTSSSAKKRACIVVLGDIGRSPRMQYHALSLLDEGYNVDVLGFSGSSPHSDVALNPDATFHYMKQCPNFSKGLPRLISYILKVLWQSWFLFLTLMRIPKSDLMLIQNPPSIPTMPVCWLVSRMRKIPLIIDWHNYGYSILALSLKPNHPLVRMCHWVEKTFGSKAVASFCVTKAMSRDLIENWGILAVTLYDRPAEMFCPISLVEKHELFMKLGKDFVIFSSSKPDVTILTERFADGQVRLREDRPGVLISSTSWTEDEDFSVLLDALDAYEIARSENTERYPPLLCIITGKGPLKEHYLKVIESREWQHVEVCTPWLEPEDYPKIIASADLGVCLHTSSSGLDLPMKVLDMFGCGIPVAAIDYKCLNELVRHEENGLVFKTSSELANQIRQWFSGFPGNNTKRELIKKNLKFFETNRWHNTWVETALPLLP